MSSLLQHDGETRGNKVVLKMYLIVEDKENLYGHRPVETYPCTACGKTHEVLYKVARRPVDMVGCWVRFRYNGAIHAPDLSIPIRVKKLPLGAERMTADAATAYWHSS